MSILGISAIYMGTPTGNTTGPKGRKDHTNILKSDIIITSIKKRVDNNFNNSNNDKETK